MKAPLSLSIPMEKATQSMDMGSPDQKRLKSNDTENESKIAEDQKEEAEEEDIPSIHIQTCLEHWASPTTIHGLKWPHLQNASHAGTNQNKFGTFPPYLFVCLQRYKLGADWVPQKLEVNVEVPEELNLNFLKSTRPLEGESLVPEEEDNNSGVNDEAPSEQQQQGPVIDEGAVEQLSAMGFTVNGCRRALSAVGGSNVEAAMNWIFEHNMDPDFNDPLPETSDGAASSSSGVDEGVVATLVESLGCFTPDQVRAALKECGSDAARAADWLFSHMDDLDSAIASLQLKNTTSSSATASSVSKEPPLQDGDGNYVLTGLISHIGKHTGSGHYVCHLKKDGKWVIFNDEKVAFSESPPIQHAFVYLFKRKDATNPIF